MKMCTVFKPKNH